MNEVDEQAFRAECYRCHKPALTCICNALPLVSNRTEVVVLQHPRERLHPIGTARFARLGLSRSSVHVAWNAGQRESEPPPWLAPRTGLLYPAPDALELSQLPPAARPERLLVLDGTWHTARTLYRDKLWLHALPHYRLAPEQPGRYRLRREPQHDYVSTIEAIVEALRILEPETPGLDALLRAFDTMIDQQIDLTRTRRGEKRSRKGRRPPPMRRVPHALIEGYARLIVLYGESARPPSGDAREFVYLIAEHLASGARFACLSLPTSGLPEPVHMQHMGLREADLVSAVGPAELRQRFQAFCAQTDPAPLFAAWNQRTLDLLARATQTPLSRTSLKGAYRVQHGTEAQSLEAVLAHEGLTPEPNGMLGRAAGRLAGAVAVTKWLHTRALAGA